MAEAKTSHLNINSQDRTLNVCVCALACVCVYARMCMHVHGCVICVHVGKGDAHTCEQSTPEEDTGCHGLSFFLPSFHELGCLIGPGVRLGANNLQGSSYLCLPQL